MMLRVLSRFLRAVAVSAVAFGCLGILLIVRVVERPFWGFRRPWTERIPRFFCRFALSVMGVGYRSRGTPMVQPGAVVANHSSWIDIFALNAGIIIYFVAKSEVAGWPLINWFSRATGTIHINRRKMEAVEHGKILGDRLCAGHRLMFFPEGTSTDGRSVLPFKSTLFSPFFMKDLNYVCWVQPVTTVYRAPEGEDPRFYGWWGDMDLASHLLKVLAAPRQGSVQVIFHPPLRVADYSGRKTLARACEVAVREGMS